MTTPETAITPVVAYPGWFRVTVTCPVTGLQESDQVQGREVAEHAAAFLALKLEQELKRMESNS